MAMRNGSGRGGAGLVALGALVLLSGCASARFSAPEAALEASLSMESPAGQFRIEFAPGNEQDAVRQLKRTYAAVAEATVAERWRMEAADARAWRDRGFDPEEVARRSEKIIARGRTQTF